MSGLFTQLTHEYYTFSQKEPELERDEARARAETLLEQIRNAGEKISNPDNRSTLSSLARDLGETIYQISGFYPLVRLAQFKPSADSSIHVPFGNREDEIREILSSSAPAYYLIDAPAGYGKTELLKKLQQHFEEREWRNAYVSVEQPQDISNITRLLADQLEVTLRADQTSMLPWGLRLGGVLRWQWDKTPKKGLVFLIDLQDNPAPSFIEELLNDFIPPVQDSLRILNFFAHKHNGFRVVFAGRYLATRPEVKHLRLKVLRLFPFNHEELQNSTRDYLVGHDEDSINQLSAHLFYITGGHPGCMALLLKMYKEQGVKPNSFLKYFSKTIWKNVLEIAHQICHELQHHFKNIYLSINKLTVFRYVDYPILNRLVECGEIIGVQDGYDLADELTATYLFDWEGRFLQNDIVRRILTILLRLERANEFKKHCQQARNMCAERLQQPNVQGPEKWTIEYLFQSLQQHANTIQEAAQREAIRKQFFSKDLPDALQAFISGRNIQPQNSREEQNALKQEITEDWEFCFTVKYYLRLNEYSDEPYNTLRQEIDRFFSSYQEQERDALVSLNGIN